MADIKNIKLEAPREKALGTPEFNRLFGDVKKMEAPREKALGTLESNRLFGDVKKAEAGQMMIENAARRIAEDRKTLEKQQEENEKDREQEREDRDTSALSKQSKWFATEGRSMESANIKWILEMEKELWEALLNWNPTADDSLSRQLEALSKLYLALLDAILTHTAGDAQAAQIDRLEEVLAQKLNLLLDADLKELLKLFEQSGQTSAILNIKSSLYKQTTGESISSGSANAFFARADTPSSSNTRYFMPASSGAEQGIKGGRSSYVSSSDEGSLYKLSKGGNVQINQEFNSHRKSGEFQISQRNLALNASKNADISSLAGQKTSYTGKELSTAENFAGHLNRSRSLFQSSGMGAQSEEARGILAAVTSIKGQIYDSGKESSMRIPFRNTVDRMVDYYLTQKGVYKVYSYTANRYEETKNVQKSISDGLSYAYRLFSEKKASGVYPQEAGFFQVLPQGRSLEEDIRRGLLLLEQNWKDFLSSIGENEKKGISLSLQRFSPWGIAEENEKLKKARKNERQENGKKGVFSLETICLALTALIILFCWVIMNT